MSPKKKMGRPVIGSLKDESIKIRLDKTLNSRLTSYSEQTGEYRTDIIRKAISQYLDEKEQKK